MNVLYYPYATPAHNQFFLPYGDEQLFNKKIA